MANFTQPDQLGFGLDQLITQLMAESTIAARITQSPRTFTLSAREHFPYDPSSTESKIFKLPLEIRQAIYLYAFHTPCTAFNKTIKGWRDAPRVEDINRRINSTALLHTNKRIREEALPIYYKHSNFQIESRYMLRKFVNTTIAADSSHLFLRKVSVIPWSPILSTQELLFWDYRSKGQPIIELLSGLPSLRYLEISEIYMPSERKEFEEEEWITLMSTITSNNGVLKVVGASLQQMWNMNGAADLFVWDERVLAMTSIEVRTWNELVSIPSQSADVPVVDQTALPLFYFIYEKAINTWTTGMKMNVTVEHLGREYKVRFWGVPEKIRQSEERKALRKAIKEENMEKKKSELARRRKGPEVSIDLGLEESEEEEIGVGEGSARNRKAKTREEARTRRMEKKVISARSKD